MKGDSTPVLLLFSLLIGGILGTVFFLAIWLSALAILFFTEDFLIYAIVHDSIWIASIFTGLITSIGTFLIFMKGRE